MWREPLEEMKRLQREINRLFNRFWGLPEFGEKALPDMRKDIQAFREPLSDLKETGKELIASIEIPGVDKNDIQLDLREDILKVKAEKKSEAKIEKEGYLRAERAYKGFYRSISLPVKVIPEKAKASYKNGVLTVRMPKAEKEEKETRRIEIE
jgi:HSP20 family protein